MLWIILTVCYRHSSWSAPMAVWRRIFQWVSILCSWMHCAKWAPLLLQNVEIFFWSGSVENPVEEFVFMLNIIPRVQVKKLLQMCEFELSFVLYTYKMNGILISEVIIMRFSKNFSHVMLWFRHQDITVSFPLTLLWTEVLKRWFNLVQRKTVFNLRMDNFPVD